MRSMVANTARTLISTHGLRDKLLGNTTKQLVVLDTAFKADRSVNARHDIYMKEHVPTSRFFDLHACVHSTPLIPRNLPESYCFTKTVRGLGIDQYSEVIVYDHSKTPEAAARTWWMFRLFGHENISILDGGFQKWVADGFEITNEKEPEIAETDFDIKLNMGLIRDMEDMKEVIRTQSVQIVDARNNDVFSGEVDHSETLAGGHIPGAFNVPNSSLFNEDGTYKSPDEIRELFAQAGVDLTKPIISMCRTAMMACSLSAAAHNIGNTDVPVYYGSWMEWANVMKDLTSTTKCINV